MQHGATDRATDDPDEAPATGEPGDAPRAGWTPPVWAYRAAARLMARVFAARTPGAGWQAAHAAAVAEGAVLGIAERDLLRACAALRGRITVLLGREPELDTVAASCSGAGANVERLSPGEARTFEASAAGAVPVLAIGQAPRAIAHALDILTALRRPLRVLAMDRARTVLRWTSGLAFPLELDFAQCAVALGPGFEPPRNATARAHLADDILLALDRSPEIEGATVVARPASRPATLRLYAAATALLSPLALPYLVLRTRAGKEVLRRLAERRGRSRAQRPEGRLVWFHAASVGESLSVLPLAREFAAHGLADAALLTTGTVTSARLIEGRATDRITHQFVPLDVPRYARRFLEHWRPDAILFVESEIWPNLMRAAAERRIPFAVVNGRMSERSFARWLRWPATARAVLASLDLVLAQTPADARRFAALGARDVRHIGNLKFDSPAPPVDPGELETVRRIMGDRPRWLAASTHEGEETFIAEAHFAIRERFPDLLTVIVPRHPDRSAAIARLLEDRWLVPARRSMAQGISAKTDIYLADTLGELGLFYRLAGVAFVGGSLVSVGGHNPIEPAQLDCAIVHGPHVHNFADTYAALDAAGGAVAVADSAELARQISDLLASEPRRTELTARGRAELARNAGSVERAMQALAPRFAA